jgi:hypothetical protein
MVTAKQIEKKIEKKMKWKSIYEAPYEEIRRKFKQAYGKYPTENELNDILLEGGF